MDHLTRKCIAVKEAETRAKDPEFKKLWNNVLVQLLEKYTNFEDKDLKEISKQYVEGKTIYEDIH